MIEQKSQEIVKVKFSKGIKLECTNFFKSTSPRWAVQTLSKNTQVSELLPARERERLLTESKPSASLHFKNKEIHKVNGA